jgi:hypothetical protein
VQAADEGAPNQAAVGARARAVHAEVPVASELYAPATHAVQAADVEAPATMPYDPNRA